MVVGVLLLGLGEVGVDLERGHGDDVELGSLAGVGADLVGNLTGVKGGGDHHLEQLRVVGSRLLSSAATMTWWGVSSTASWQL